MEKWEAVKTLKVAANIAESIMFDGDGKQRSDEKIKFILQAVNQTVESTVKPDFEKLFNVMFDIKSGKKDQHNAHKNMGGERNVGRI